MAMLKIMDKAVKLFLMLTVKMSHVFICGLIYLIFPSSSAESKQNLDFFLIFHSNTQKSIFLFCFIKIDNKMNIYIL